MTHDYVLLHKRGDARSTFVAALVNPFEAARAFVDRTGADLALDEIALDLEAGNVLERPVDDDGGAYIVCRIDVMPAEAVPAVTRVANVGAQSIGAAAVDAVRSAMVLTDVMLAERLLAMIDQPQILSLPERTALLLEAAHRLGRNR